MKEGKIPRIENKYKASPTYRRFCPAVPTEIWLLRHIFCLWRHHKDFVT